MEPLFRLRLGETGHALEDGEDLLVVLAGRGQKDPLALQHRLGEDGARRIEIGIGGLGTARAKDDVRPDQAGEEHDLGGQKEPHRDLAGRHRRVLDARRRGRRDVVGKCGLGRYRAVCHGQIHPSSLRSLRRRLIGSIESGRHRVQEQKHQDRGQVDERGPQEVPGGQVGHLATRTGRRNTGRQPQQECPREVEPPGQADDRRQESRGDQRQGVSGGLPASDRAGGSTVGSIR